MHNPTVSTAATTKPEIKPSRDGQSPGWFRNPLPGHAGTTVTAEFMNELLAMIRATLTDGGVAFTDGVDENRLRDAVRAIAVAQTNNQVLTEQIWSGSESSGTHTLDDSKQFSDYDFIVGYNSISSFSTSAGNLIIKVDDFEVNGRGLGNQHGTSGYIFVTRASDTSFLITSNSSILLSLHGVKL